MDMTGHGGDVITNEPEHDTGNTVKDEGTLREAGAVDTLRATWIRRSRKISVSSMHADTVAHSAAGLESFG